MPEHLAPSWQDELERTGEVVLRMRRRRSALLLVLCALLALAGGWLVFAVSGPAATIAGSVGLVVFGLLGVPAFARTVLSGRPYVIVTRDVVRAGSAEIAWRDVLEVRLWTYQIRGSTLVHVMLVYEEDAATRVAATVSPLRRRLMLLKTPAMDENMFGLPLNWRPTETKQLASWLTELHRRLTAV